MAGHADDATIVPGIKSSSKRSALVSRSSSNLTSRDGIDRMVQQMPPARFARLIPFDQTHRSHETGGTRMTRAELTSQILTAIRDRNVTYAELGQALGRHPVWTAAACHGQASLSADEAGTLLSTLGISLDWVPVLQQPPTKGAVGRDVPVDPLIYRFHEITQVYGPAIKAVIHEMFGDGIMSAIDFELDIQKQEDPKGDRVVVTFNGKFLPYRKW
jgi:cyanate lyase